MKRKPYPFLIIAGIAAAILVVAIFWHNVNEPSPTPPDAMPAKQATPSIISSPSLEKNNINSAAIAPPTIRNATSHLSATQLIARSDLEDALATAHGIKLSAAQTKGILDAYGTIYEARLDYEAAHAKVNSLSEHENLIEILSYEADGAQFKNQLEKSFQQVLGDELAARLNTEVSPMINSHNAHWGKYPQAMVVSYNLRNDTYTVDYTLNPGSNGPKREGGGIISRNMLNLYEKFLPLFPK